MNIQATAVRKDFLRKGGDSNIFTAVHETDLTLEEGKILAIRGRSGSGKSTLLNMISGILKPTAGTVRCGEQDLYALSDEALSDFRNRHIGYIPQGTSAISSLTVMENILLPHRIRKNDIPEGAIAERAQDLMSRMEIGHLKDEKPGKLSGGELRRMAIARALILRPEIVLADEPTGDLDDENTKIVFTMMKNCAKEGASVLIVTHEEDVERYADRILRMDSGRLAAQ